ncbi:TonB system transport protein TonB [Xenorhabdus sp. IM139775]|uniref:TonB system transport protein TonB n=1 Tax=Xenorhabdus sp. IM139775 TaxID=3025876 RepID=UPI00235878C2|nr:TonB system transport protein TonB [Xenorhabdus sp. IM139775]MDC9592357.1 TonB system transport protein TonB [Xenorhabdus sp. IM139775]
MLLSKNSLMRWIHWPILFSVCLHVSIATALLHAIKPEKQVQAVPMSVAMIQLAAEEAPVSKPAMSESLPEPEPEPEPIAEVALPKPEKKKIVKKERKPKEKRAEKVSEQPLKSISDQEPQMAKNLDDQKSVQPVISEKGSVRNGPKALNRPEPTYPSRALQLGTEGTVKVKFDIDENGRVKNIEIVSATPRNIFEREVRNAMRKWRYEKIPATGHITTIEFRTTGISQS